MKNYLKTFSARTVYISFGLLLGALLFIAIASTRAGMSDEDKINRAREIQAQAHTGKKMLEKETEEYYAEIKTLETDIEALRLKIEVNETAGKLFTNTWHREQGKIDQIKDKEADFQ